MINHVMQKADSPQILVVDDSLDSLKLLADMLTSHGYQVRQASSGHLALKSVAIEAPDLILLDVKMPDLDGYEVCRRLKFDEGSRRIPLIFISALDEAVDKVEGFHAGGVDYITKPFQVTEILARVETHLALRGLQKKLEAQQTQIQREIAERERAEEALKKYKAHLEEFVTERTADLRKLNEELQREIVEHKRAEEQLSGIINSAMDAIITVDENRRIVLFNPAAEQMLRCPTTEAEGQLIDRFIPERFHTAHAKQIHSFSENGLTHRHMGALGAITGRRADGEEFPVEASISRTEANGRKLLAVILRDITERKQAEEQINLLQTIAVEAAEAKDLASALKVVLRHVCEKTGWVLGEVWMPSQDKTVLRCNPAWFATTSEFEEFRAISEGFTFPRGIGLPGRVWSSRQPVWVRDVTLSDEYLRAQVARKVGLKAGLGLPILSGDEVIAVIEFFLHEPRSEDERLVKVVATVAAQLGLVIERKKAQEQLQESQTRLAGVIESAMDAVISIDSEQRIQIFNAAAEKMFHCSAAQAIGQSINRFIPERFRSVHTEHIVKYGQTGETNRVMGALGEIIGLRVIGEEFPVEASISQIESSGQKLFTVILRDITKRKRLEAQLRQAQKMEAIGRLAGGIAHDFNNLLTAILGYTRLLLDDLPPHDPHHRDLESIHQAGERAATLTRQLLAFSRQQPMLARPLGLNLVVTNLHTLLHRLIGEDVELITQLDPALGLIQADFGQMEQVIMNLVINARDAMPQGGKLVIETANFEVDADFAHLHLGLYPGPYVVLTVNDTGQGMDAATMSRIFEPFFTTKELGQGTGLGLATVYGIVQQSGGAIWVYSEVEQGTTFKIYLPRLTEPFQALPPPLQNTAVPGGSETILLAEDEVGVRELVAETLRRNGYTVLVAANGPEALRLSEQHRQPIHLLVTDVVMPGMSGWALVEQLGSQRPEMKVLFISGYTDDMIIHHGILEAADLILLQKPFSPDTLARKVREVLDEVKT